MKLAVQKNHLGGQILYRIDCKEKTRFSKLELIVFTFRLLQFSYRSRQFRIEGFALQCSLSVTILFLSNTDFWIKIKFQKHSWSKYRVLSNIVNISKFFIFLSTSSVFGQSKWPWRRFLEEGPHFCWKFDRLNNFFKQRTSYHFKAAEFINL